MNLSLKRRLSLGGSWADATEGAAAAAAAASATAGGSGSESVGPTNQQILLNALLKKTHSIARDLEQVSQFYTKSCVEIKPWGYQDNQYFWSEFTELMATEGAKELVKEGDITQIFDSFPAKVIIQVFQSSTTNRCIQVLRNSSNNSGLWLSISPFQMVSGTAAKALARSGFLILKQFCEANGIPEDMIKSDLPNGPLAAKYPHWQHAVWVGGDFHLMLTAEVKQIDETQVGGPQMLLIRYKDYLTCGGNTTVLSFLEFKEEIEALENFLNYGMPIVTEGSTENLVPLEFAKVRQEQAEARAARAQAAATDSSDQDHAMDGEANEAGKGSKGGQGGKDKGKGKKGGSDKSGKGIKGFKGGTGKGNGGKDKMKGAKGKFGGKYSNGGHYNTKGSW